MKCLILAFVNCQNGSPIANCKLLIWTLTILPSVEYYCHCWAGTPSYYLKLLDKLQKQICRNVGPSIASSLEPLAHPRNVASLNLSYRYYFSRYSSKLAELVLLPYSLFSRKVYLLFWLIASVFCHYS